MKPQASKATPEEIAEHCRRQREHGERMIDDDDKPELIEFLITGVILLAVFLMWWN